MARKAAAANLEYKSALVLQCLVRKKAARSFFMKSMAAVCIIQLAWRQAVQRKSQAVLARATKLIEQQLKVEANSASKKISRFFKNISMRKSRMTATLILQKWYRAYLPLLRARIMTRGFLRLQVCYRSTFS